MAGLAEVANIKRQNQLMRARQKYAPSLVESQALPLTSLYRPDLAGMTGRNDGHTFGPRWDMRDGMKGTGWLGLIDHPNGGVATEVSIDGPDAYGEIRGQPSIVPTLTREELDYILSKKGKWNSKNPIVKSIYKKSDEHAALRRAQGLSPFVD